MKTRIYGLIAGIVFLISIPASNAWLSAHGLWDAPLIGPVPSALWIVAISFVARDFLQITLGKRIAWIGIAAGTAASYLLADPMVATASCVAFAVSESADALIFTPLANRGRFLVAVIVSGYIAGFLDSALFVRIAFGSWTGWWQLGVAKAVVLLCATPIAWIVRLSLTDE